MSDTMSGPNDWLHFYDNTYTGQLLPSSVSDATTVTTTTPTQLSPEGGVSKPIRRRSRASRRTPTTLLNTDTTNFRAMVQQFTGGPTAPFAPTASALPNLGLGFGPRAVHVNPNGMVIGHHLEQQQQQQQQQVYHPQEQHYMYSGNNREGGENMFFQRLSNLPNVSGDVMNHGGRFFPSGSS